MNFYTVAIEGMPGLLLNAKYSMNDFKRDLYPKAFNKYYEQNLVIFEALENGYTGVVDKEQFIKNMAEALVKAAEETLAAEVKKSKRESMLLDFNLCLAIYTYPAISEFKGTSSEPFRDALMVAWKEAFPKTNVQASTFEDINKGFKRKFCYITTAACETFGKADDCYELNLLREYRDDYLMSQVDGESIVQEYYDLAPTIVKHINQKAESREIYAEIWKDYIDPCIHLIEQNEKKACRELYVKMVRDLQEQYFVS